MDKILLKLQEAATLLEYKDGKFGVHAIPGYPQGSYELRIDTMRPNSVRNGYQGLVNVRGSQFFPWYSANHISTEIRRQSQRLIHDLEIHEADEWLRFDGELIHDPHANDFQAKLLSYGGAGD